MRILLLTPALLVAACGSSADPVDQPAAVENAGAESAPVETAEPAPAAEAMDTQIAAATANAAPAAFAQCKVCHNVEPGKNGIGPSLAGVFGAKAGHITGFSYSADMQSSGLIWDEATLDKFLTSPKALVTDTRMTFAGQHDPEKREEIIAYLKTL